MAEAFLGGKATSKKRKAEAGLSTSNKKKMTDFSSTHINPNDPRIASFQPSINVDQSHEGVNHQINGEYKRTFHIGAKRYLIFHGENGIVENIFIMEWDGKKVTNKGVQLNVSKLVVMMHYGEVMTNEVEKIIKGESEVDKKMHIGGGMYLTSTSPYKTMGIRRWKKNNANELYPRSDGISLKINEWRECLKYVKKMYSEKIELYTYIPCIIQPDKADHNHLTCPECIIEDVSAKGEVDVDIPI